MQFIKSKTMKLLIHNIKQIVFSNTREEEICIEIDKILNMFIFSPNVKKNNNKELQPIPNMNRDNKVMSFQLDQSPDTTTLLLPACTSSTIK